IEGDAYLGLGERDLVLVGVPAEGDIEATSESCLKQTERTEARAAPSLIKGGVAGSLPFSIGKDRGIRSFRTDADNHFVFPLFLLGTFPMEQYNHAFCTGETPVPPGKPCREAGAAGPGLPYYKGVGRGV